MRDLMDVRRVLMPAVKKNQANREAEEAFTNMAAYAIRFLFIIVLRFIIFSFVRYLSQLICNVF